jgi:hypothetical protein
MDRTGSVWRQMAGYNINGVNPSGSATTLFVSTLVSRVTLYLGVSDTLCT